eukprot:gnl/Dysnectes_brevis/362_a402_5754.p1 GENE.gnl/Dysnectes_brevis/362_a402_5754~~gnl/Dysnectes_brevis/362_a402_5754.p1  ORF type:complete len:249 (+),score=64.15 gnl/Dysnectes_brevis/362_a402_5754:815-1561(+)
MSGEEQYKFSDSSDTEKYDKQLSDALLPISTKLEAEYSQSVRYLAEAKISHKLPESFSIGPIIHFFIWNNELIHLETASQMLFSLGRNADAVCCFIVAHQHQPTNPRLLNALKQQTAHMEPHCPRLQAFNESIGSDYATSSSALSQHAKEIIADHSQPSWLRLFAHFAIGWTAQRAAQFQEAQIAYQQAASHPHPLAARLAEVSSALVTPTQQNEALQAVIRDNDPFSAAPARQHRGPFDRGGPLCGC